MQYVMLSPKEHAVKFFWEVTINIIWESNFELTLRHIQMIIIYYSVFLYLN